MATMPRLRAALLLAVLPLLPGCRSSYEEVDNRAYAECQQCQEEGTCADVKAACEADATCVKCIETPFALTCASNENWLALAGCSCFDCASDCSHTCPAGQGACESCGLQSCPDETQACLADSECIGCLGNPSAAGCAESTTFQDFLACGCDKCGQECVWSCPDAIAECGGCALDSCAEAYGTCLMDETCAACSDNPSLPECETDPLTLELVGCVCSNCDATCGTLFQCGG